MQENISQNEIQVLDLHFFKVYNLKMAGISRRPTKFMAENGMSGIEMISAKSLLEPGRKKVAGLQHSASAHRSKLQQMATTGAASSSTAANSFSSNRKWPYWSHLQQTANSNTAVLL